jgi:hypothetical protein
MPEPPDLDALARRYLDLWQDQVTAMAGDPQLAAAFARMFESAASVMPMQWLGVWLQAAQAAMRAGVAGGDDGGRFATDAKAGAAAAAAASGHRGGDVAGLRRRLADLEARVARLESAPAAGPGRGKRDPVRRAAAKPRKRRS